MLDIRQWRDEKLTSIRQFIGPLPIPHDLLRKHAIPIPVHKDMRIISLLEEEVRNGG